MSQRLHSKQPVLRPLALAVALSALGTSTAWANDRAELEQLRATTASLINTLVDSGLLTREKADALIKQSQQAKPAVAGQSAEPAQDASTSKKASVIRVPYVPESLKNEMREDIKREVLQQARSERWGEPGALPAWLRRLSFEGDVRVRLQSEDWDKNNFGANETFSYPDQVNSPAWSPDLTNTNNGRLRSTLRARFGVSSDLAFGFKTGLRLTTGNTTPVSTSQTLGGSDGNLGKYNVFLDRAWVQWTAYQPDLTLYAGRFANPFSGGDLAWPDDLNFDGVAANYKHKVDDANELFASAGAFPLQEFQTAAQDKWLYGVQLGANFKPDAGSTFSLGLAYYDFNAAEGQYDPGFADTAAVGSSYLSSAYPKSVRQKGNTLIRINPGTASNGSTVVSPVWGLASKFKPLVLSTSWSYAGWDELFVKANFDLIKNTGFDINDIRQRADSPSLDIAKKTTALQARVQIGSPKQELKGDWSAFLTWRRFERDSWVDAFTDTTWHLGGTNYSGFSLGSAYYVGPRTSVGLRLTSTRNLKDGRTELVNGAQVPNLSSTDLKIDVIQLELNSRF